MLLLTSVVAFPAAGALSGTFTSTGVSSPTTYQATEHVEIWERAGLPLRADPADAQKTITNPALTVNYQPDNTGPLDARKAKTAVYGTGSSISVVLEEGVTGAPIEPFDGRETQLVVAHIEPDASTDLADLALPADLDEARDLLDPENANSNASFTVSDAGPVGSGAVHTSFTPNDAGMYVIFLATNSTGKTGSFSETNGDLSVSGNVTIIGMDSVLVQQSAASVSPAKSSVVRGNSVDFAVSSPSGTNLNHTLVIYREATWTNAEFELVAKNQISADMDESDFKLKHSVDTVEGVSDFDGPVTVMGATFNDDHYDGTTTTPALLDFIVERANDETDSSVSSIQTESTGDTTLYASAAGVANADGPQTLTIETQSGWATGTYRWVYLGGGRDNSDVYTQTGTINVKKKSTSTPPSTTPPDDTPPDDTPPVETPRATVEKGGGTVTVETSGAATKIVVKDATKGAEVELTLPSADVEKNLKETGSAVNGMRMNFQEDSDFDANVSFSATKPDSNVPDVVEGEDQAFGYINVDHTASDEALSSVTFQFSVTKAKLTERGVAPGDVLLFRYNNGRWTGYDTTVVSESENAYTFEATVPGLSVFAIGSKKQATTTFDVTSASVSAATVDIAEDFQVTAEIENTGNYKGTFNADLIVDGTVEETKSVEIPAGESREVAFTWELVEAGDHEIQVNDASAGTVNVRSQETTTTTTTTPPTTTATPPTTTTPVEPRGPVSTPTIAFAVVLLAVLAAGAVFLYRQGYFD